MNEQAVDKLISDRIRFGGDVEMALGRFGIGVGAGTTTHFGEDLYAFSKSEGLYGGMALEGTVVEPKHAWNEAYYGRRVNPKDIVRTPGGGRTEIAALHESLTRF
jgi:SH3 domain-containing YSC84-like protein 1